MIKDLIRRSRDGRDACYSGLKELEEAGYLVRQLIRDKDGAFIEYEYTVYEAPQSSSPLTENPDTGNPDTENPEHNKDRKSVKKDLSKNYSSCTYTRAQQSCVSLAHEENLDLVEQEESEPGGEEVELDPPVPCQKDAEVIARTERTSETNIPPRREKAPRKAKSEEPKTEKPKHKINSLGWLQMDRAKKYKLARAIATKRICYQVAMIFSAFSFGDLVENQREVVYDNGKEKIVNLENNCFGRGDILDFATLRDRCFDAELINQEVFNDLLESIFDSTVKWLTDQGVHAKRILDSTSMVDLFFKSDRALLKQIQAQHE